MTQKRTHSRLMPPVPLTAVIDDRYEGSVLDISMVGVRCCFEAEVPLGKSHQLKLKLNGQEARVSAHAAWVHRKNGAQQVGFNFLDVPGDSRLVLSSYLTAQYSDQHEPGAF